jgi:cobalt-zinc-cadmium resistance protein CzcA
MNAGETNRLEMITARSQSMELRNQLQQIYADITNYNQKLQTLLNTESAISPADTLLIRAVYLPTADSLLLTGNPSVGYEQQQIEVSHFESNLEQSRMLPDLSIGYFTQTMTGVQEVNGIPRTFGPGDRFTGIQAGIAIPLWFVPHSSKIKAARLKEKFAQTNAENYAKSIWSDYRSLLGDYAKYNNSLNYYEKQAIPEANLIIDQATRSYKAGALDYLDYIQSLTRTLNIKMNYLDALNNYNQTIISIDFITGKIF